jgi:hypothetical protein
MHAIRFIHKEIRNQSDHNENFRIVDVFNKLLNVRHIEFSDRNCMIIDHTLR